MKKVKIMLTAITVFAVVGGALAFKTKSATLYCSTTQASSGCPNSVEFENSTYTESASGQSFCTIDVAGTCDVPVTDIRSNQ